jgi:hypothetical protein
MPPTITMMPSCAMRADPIRSTTSPAMGIISIAPKPCGASSRPADSAPSPRTCWKYSGNSSIAPKNATVNSTIVTEATENARFRNSFRSMSAFSVRDACQMKPATSSAPPIAGR